MLATRRTAAQTVFDHLKSAERTADLAIAETAELVAAMLRARIAVGVAPMVGQEAFDLAVETLNSQADSRRQLIAAHACLAEVRDGLGLREFALGGLENKQVRESFASAEPGPADDRGLSLVTAVAA